MKKMFCGDCMKMIKPEDMYSDYTCKKCAKELGLETFTDPVFYGM